eukprot:2892501-Pyramimonas_sp.AAC.1
MAPRKRLLSHMEFVQGIYTLLEFEQLKGFGDQRQPPRGDPPSPDLPLPSPPRGRAFRRYCWGRRTPYTGHLGMSYHVALSPSACSPTQRCIGALGRAIETTLRWPLSSREPGCQTLL